MHHDPFLAQAIARIAVLFNLFAFAGTVPLHAVAEPAPGANLAYDFLLQNVCLDKNGKVLFGVSPIDGNPECTAQRDLRPGEPLPYHEREWPSLNLPDVLQQTRGSDSFPVTTRNLGVIAIHVFDYKQRGWVGTFDQYSPVQRMGGGSIAALSNELVSYVATQFGLQDLQLFVGSACAPGEPVQGRDLFDSWVIVPLAGLASVKLPAIVPDNPEPAAEGIISSRIQIVYSNPKAHCPPRMSVGSTRWSIRPVTYRAIYKSGPLAGKHVRLWSLIATRANRSADEQDSAVSFERAYFTRELGWTRWEAWKSINWKFRAPNRPGFLDLPTLQAQVIRRGNCELPDINSPGKFHLPAAPLDSRSNPRPDLVMEGCIEVTKIVPPQNPTGDPAPTGPGSWYASITTDHSLSTQLFGQ